MTHARPYAHMSCVGNRAPHDRYGQGPVLPVEANGDDLPGAEVDTETSVVTDRFSSGRRSRSVRTADPNGPVTRSVVGCCDIATRRTCVPSSVARTTLTATPVPETAI